MEEKGAALNHEQVGSILEQTIKALDEKEGCNVEGTVIINKVPGNFHLSTHAFGDVVQRLYMGGRRLDFTHTIKHLSFGDDDVMKTIEAKFGDKFQFDLDGTKIDQNQYLYQGQLLANYYLDVNEVEYMDETNPNLARFYEGYKHRTSRSLLAQLGLPAIFFRYELSPIKLRYTVSYKSGTAFLIQICAIIGGLFTVAGIMDAFIRNSFSFVAGGDKKK